jgi:hypothetical protein
VIAKADQLCPLPGQRRMYFYTVGLQTRRPRLSNSPWIPYDSTACALAI